ncbi:MAG TPA: hypothetical protein VMZ28_19235 [Kofleriaceae bacterium]|nr:hypothetical protein [Kofleriaceae bacterium]
MKRHLAAGLVLLLPACAELRADTPAGDGGQAGTDGARPATDGDPVCSESAVPDGEPSGAAGPRVVIDAATTRFEVSPALLGANVNKWYDDAQGLWDATAGAPVADAVEKTARAGVGLLRHPGGTSANLFDWKRAVGPRAARRCQTDGATLAGRPDTSYGPSEFMQLVQAAGADAQIMVPFASESPADAADWVEYMNAPVGTNPNGGTAWAEVRQADGSPEPYGVTRWEIGNEQDRGGHQAYWLSKDDDTRIAQYIEGAVIQFTNQPAGRACDFGRTTTTAAAGQRFYILYGLIKNGTDPVVKVGGAVWTPVADLATAGAADQVYALDRGDASFVFGDGVHGAIPPAGQEVTVSYTFQHRGFVAVYDAMKATAAEIGIEIDVCAAWAPPAPRGTDRATLGSPSFPAAMASRGLADRYDCVAMHPYTNFGRDFGDAWDDAAEGYDEHMLGDGWSKIMVDDLTEEVRARSIAGTDGRKAFVTISELGALWFGDSEADAASKEALPAFSSTMTHALFMASQWIHFARLGVRWVEGNTLVAERHGIRGVLGGSATGFVYGAEALTREALAPVFADGARWTASRVEDNEIVTVGAEGDWPVLVAGATTGADGALRIVVVNRRMNQAQAARVVPEGFVHGATVEVTLVRGDSFKSYNDGEPGGGDDSVEITTDTIEVDAASFDHSFPAASVTLLTLRPPC